MQGLSNGLDSSSDRQIGNIGLRKWVAGFIFLVFASCMGFLEDLSHALDASIKLGKTGGRKRASCIN